MFKRTLAATAVAASMAIALSPASAQQAGLVNVDISDINLELTRIISDNNIDVDVPLNAVVQVPVGIAANICNVSAAVLARQDASAAPCDATNSTANSNEMRQLLKSLQRQER